MDITYLPSLNAVLNFISSVLLMFGFINIKKGRQETHKKFMFAAVITSALFLISYVIYHYYAGSVPYPHHDWTRPLYFIILIPHVILAALMVPFILYLLYQALKGQFEKHKKVARFTFPVWMFVSISGVVIYLMLYHL